jgi:hypothetical protein
MSPRGAHRLWLRTVAAVAASLLALASTGALVTAAVVAPPAAAATTSPAPSHSAGTDQRRADILKAIIAAIRKHEHPRVTPPATTPHPTPKPHPTPAVKPATHVAHGVAPAAVPRAVPHQPAPAKPAPTARVVVDSSDPAPFSAAPVAATEVARVLPIERLGPLSGISFGSGLFIWPLLLAVDVFALAVLTRMALRRRLASPED